LAIDVLGDFKAAGIADAAGEFEVGASKAAGVGVGARGQGSAIEVTEKMTLLVPTAPLPPLVQPRRKFVSAGCVGSKLPRRHHGPILLISHRAAVLHSPIPFRLPCRFF